MSSDSKPQSSADPQSETDGLCAETPNAECRRKVPKLTFGVEFEYLYICLETDVPPEEWDAYGRSVVRGILSQTLHAKCDRCRTRVPFKLPLFPGSRLNIDDKDFSRWDVGPEALHVPREEAEFLGPNRHSYAFFSVEISSRILQASKFLEVPVEDGGSDHIHQISYAEEINAVLSKLRREFCTFDGHQKLDYLFSSDVCGFHVHVGNFENGFDLQTVKNVQCLDIACERIIDQIHAKQRINGTDLALRPLRWPAHIVDGDRTHCMDPTTYNSPTSEKFLTRTYWARYRNSDHGDDEELMLRTMQRRIWEESVYPESKFDCKPGLADAWGRNDMDSWMQVVQHADDLRDLSNLAAPHTKASNISIYHLLPKGMSHCKHTLEFRQHASTLQTAPVLAWIDFVVRAVDWCQGASWDNLKPYIGENGILRTTRSNMVDLCQLVKCSEATLKHYSNVVSGRNRDYAQHLREQEFDQARQYQYLGDPLVSFALASIRWERRNLCMRNIRRRIHQKLMSGGMYDQHKRNPRSNRKTANMPIFEGYGQFSAEFVKGIANTNEDLSILDQTLERITLGFESPVLPTPEYGYSQCTFREQTAESIPSDTDSRLSRSSSPASVSSAPLWPRSLLSSARASPELSPVSPAQMVSRLPPQSVLRNLQRRRRSSSPDLGVPLGLPSRANAEWEDDSGEDDRLGRSQRRTSQVHLGRSIRLPQRRKARISVCSC